MEPSQLTRTEDLESKGHFMRWLALIRDIGEGAKAQPGRVGLAFASLSIGMASLVSLLAILGGVRQKTQQMIGELGVNVFGLVQPSEDTRRTERLPLSRRHLDNLAANLPNAIVTGIRLEDSAAAGLPPGVVLAATDETLFQVRPWRIVKGRPFDATDIRTRSRCAIVSSTLAQSMKLQVGETVLLRNLTFRIIGLMDIESGALEASDIQRTVAPGNRLVLVPWSVPAYWSNAPVPTATRLDSIFIKGSIPSRFDELIRQTGLLLNQPDNAVEGISWVTPQTLLQRLIRYQRLIMLAGGTIVLLCLVLGGLTLTSLLLAGVQTRIPEIGLRRALGASPTDIGILFMCEALMVTLSASLAGTTGAWALITLLHSLSPLPLHLGPAMFIIPMSSGTLIGIIFSYWPARSAARISPAEALRNE